MLSPLVRVFVSSTWLDLHPERAAVETAIHRLRETWFAGLELAGSLPEIAGAPPSRRWLAATSASASSLAVTAVAQSKPNTVRGARWACPV